MFTDSASQGKEFSLKRRSIIFSTSTMLMFEVFILWISWVDSLYFLSFLWPEITHDTFFCGVVGTGSEERKYILRVMSYDNSYNVGVYGKKIKYYCGSPDTKLQFSFPRFLIFLHFSCFCQIHLE